MTVRRSIALGLWGLALVAGSLTVVLVFGNAATLEDDRLFGLFVTLLMIDALAFSSAGALVIFRRPANRVGWIMAAIGPVISLTFLGFVGGAIMTLRSGSDDLLAGLFSVMGSSGFYPLFMLVALLLIVFPDGDLPSRRWQLPVAVVYGVLILGTVYFVIRPGPPDAGLAVNPLGIDLPGSVALTPVIVAAASFAMPVALLLGVVALVVRYRRGEPDLRRQIKWLVAAAAACGLLVPVSVLYEEEAIQLFDIIAVGSLALLPLAVSIAILRYRLYEIDRLVSRTVSWAIVTAIIIATFVVGLLALQTLLSGITQGDTIAVAASTLFALAVFQPVRQRVQRAVDRRFDRARYDAERVIEEFATRLRDELDLTLVASEVGRVATETVRPTQAGVWIRATDGSGR